MTTISNRWPRTLQTCFPMLLEVRKEVFINFGDTPLNPGPAEIPILLTYGRRFMCSSSTSFSFVRVVVSVVFNDSTWVNFSKLHLEKKDISPSWLCNLPVETTGVTVAVKMKSQRSQALQQRPKRFKPRMVDHPCHQKPSMTDFLASDTRFTIRVLPQGKHIVSKVFNWSFFCSSRLSGYLPWSAYHTFKNTVKLYNPPLGNPALVKT